MRKSAILTLCLAALLPWGCGKTAEVNAPLKKGITFSASIGGYATKATDTAFEDGDLIGLYGTTLGYIYDNALLESRSGKLVPLNPMEEQADAQLSFQAYYPYKPDNDKYFYVNADQSTWEQYTASDLMMAEFKGTPDRNGNVNLVFGHMLSKFVVIPSRDADLIANVYIANVMGQVHWDFRYTNELGTTGTIKALPSDYYGEPAWKAIIPPHWATPRILVERTDGSCYEYRLNDPIYLESGTQILARLNMQEDEPTADVSVEIEAWTPDNEAAFGPSGFGTFLPEMVNTGVFSLEAEEETKFDAECQLAWNHDKLVISNGRNLFWCYPELNSDPSFIANINRADPPLRPELLASDDAGHVVIGNCTANILQVIYTDDILNGAWSTLIDEADLTTYGTVGRMSITGNIQEKAVLTLTCSTSGEFNQFVLCWEIQNGDPVASEVFTVRGDSQIWLATTNGAVALGDTIAEGIWFHAYADGLRNITLLPDMEQILPYEWLLDEASGNSNFNALDVAWYKNHRLVATAPGEFFLYSPRRAFLINADQWGGRTGYWSILDTSIWLTNENYTDPAPYSSSNALLVPTPDGLFYFILANAHKRIVWFHLQ